MFSKETEYAIRGLVYIWQQNNKGAMPGMEEIAREIDAPRFYAAKIMQRMVKLGFLKSQRGKGGGFFFDKDKPALPLRDVILNTEGDKALSGCGFGLMRCDGLHPCPLHQKYAPVRESLNQLVSSETVQSLASRL